MPDISVHITGQSPVSAELDLESGILRFSYQDRERLLRTSEEMVTAEIEGLTLDASVMINPLTQRIMLTESALVTAQAILAG